MACDECDRLRRQVRELREEVAEWSARDGGNPDRILALRLRLRIRPTTAKVVDTLIENAGSLVATEFLASRAGCNESESIKGMAGIINTQVYFARQALTDKIGRHGITTLYGEGYTMTKEAARAVEGLL